MSATYVDKNGQVHPDRRQQRHLRDFFEGVRGIMEPFHGAAASWGNQDLSYLARRQIQESYPQLSLQEINVLINAVNRVLAEERAVRAA
jgi:hypothetical protein